MSAKIIDTLKTEGKQIEFEDSYIVCWQFIVSRFRKKLILFELLSPFDFFPLNLSVFPCYSCLH